MKTKYIQVQHLNYYDALYELMGNTASDLTGVEFGLTDDFKGKDNYFWLDFYNLTALNHSDLMDDENMPQYLCEQLNAGEIDFFIRSAYFPTPDVFYSPDDFVSKTIFEQKNLIAPFYIHVCLNEKEPLTPPNIIKWLGKLSLTLFGEQFDFKMGEIEAKEQSILRCKEEFENQGKPYFLKAKTDGFLTYKYSGWSEFKLGDFISDVSGITNFPLDIANGLIKALKGGVPISVGFDEEGTEFTLLLDIYDRVCIIAYDDKEVKIYKCKVTHKKLADMFLNDMQRDFEKYTADDYFFDFAKDKQEQFAQELHSKLKTIERLIQ